MPRRAALLLVAIVAALAIFVLANGFASRFQQWLAVDLWKGSGATFDVGNAVGLNIEIGIIAFLLASYVGGLLFVLRARPEDGVAGRHEIGMAALVGLAAFVWLDHVNGGAWTGQDQSAGLLLAQDCLQLGICHLTSVESGISGFTNGAVWLHLLTAVGLVGGTTVAVRATLILLMAAGISAVFLCTWRWLRPAFALPAALAALVGVVGGGVFDPTQDVVGQLSAANLVDASATFFPAAICACLLLIFVATRRTVALLLATVLAAHAFNTHVAAVSIAPALVATAGLAARRPLAAIALTFVTYLGATLLTSPFALLTDLERIGPTRTLEVLVGLAGFAGLCRLGNPFFARLPFSARAAVLALLLVGPPLSAEAWLYLAQHRQVTSRYLAPMIAPLATIAGTLIVAALTGITKHQHHLARLGQALPVILGVACVYAVGAPRSGGEWTFEDGRVLAAHLATREWCYSRQLARFQGNQCRSITYATMPYACHARFDSRAADPRQQLRVWLADPDRLPQLPSLSEVLPVAPHRAIVVSTIDSWIDKSQAERCITPYPVRDNGSTAVCVRPEDSDAPPFLYSHRLYLGFNDAMFQPPYTLTFAFPIQPTVGETRQFYFGAEPLTPGVQTGCGWQVTQAPGLEADPPLPANPVRLRSADGAASRIVIERVVGGGKCNDGFPGSQIPCHLETLPSDPPWMAERGS